MDKDEASEYRKMLIQSIHTCATRFPNIAGSVVHVLMDFLNVEGSIDVILFVRDIAETQPKMRGDVLSKLVDGVADIRISNVARGAFWILGEYAQGDLIDSAFKAIQETLGSLPFVTEEQEAIAAGLAAPPVETGKRAAVEITTTVTVLPDGTYATQTALTESNRGGDDDDSGPAVRKLILEGDWFLAAVAVVSLAKLALKKAKEVGETSAVAKEMALSTLLTACSLIKAGESKAVKTKMDADSKDRISFCLRALLDASSRPTIEPLLTGQTRAIFTQMVSQKKAEAEKSRREAEAALKTQPFELIAFRQLRGRNVLGSSEETDDDTAFAQAVKGVGGSETGASRKFVSRTNNRVNVYTSNAAAASGGPDDGAGGKNSDQYTRKNIHALTGSSDPVYVEATVVVHDFDIVIDFLIINRTEQTLTNVEVELFVVGDLKITDRHAPFTMAPRDQRMLTTNIKVSSTETGHVFGNISFDHPQQLTTNIVSLQEIYIDIMNYIKPGTCTDAEFRSMWAEFEWENKVAVFTIIPDCRQFLRHIQALTNMTCLTPIDDRPVDSSDEFLAANLYATSVFGEAALLNLSIEKSAVSGKIEGFIRIRAKNQGIALSLGDRITMKQKGTEDIAKKA